MNTLELQGITVRYRDKTALNNVSLTLGPGVWGLLGPNGAGKSTLMAVLTGNLRPTGGRVLWNREDIRRLGADYRTLLGFAPQGQGLYDGFTGRRFLSYMAALKGIARRDQPGEIDRALRRVHMESDADRPMAACSGGMRQRLLIAQAILGDPKLLILDEPSAGLDPRERVRLRGLIRELAEGRTVLVSTHVVSDVETIAREIILLKDGTVAGRGDPEELCTRYGAGSLEEVCMDLLGEEDRDGPTDAS